MTDLDIAEVRARAKEQANRIAQVFGSVDVYESELIVAAVAAYVSTPACTEDQKNASLTLMLKLAGVVESASFKEAAIKAAIYHLETLSTASAVAEPSNEAI